MTSSDLKQRLAAILAADVAGYSRLMSRDERATIAALDTARGVFKYQIEAHQGRVIDMAGDSVLAVFETATGAVSAALAVQRELDASSRSAPEDNRMQFRIGVHLGDVIVKADGTVYGDGVNIAARLQGLAEPGGITVSDAVRGAVRGNVTASFVEQGEQRLKNIAEAVNVFRIRAAGAKSRPAEILIRHPARYIALAAAAVGIGAVSYYKWNLVEEEDSRSSPNRMRNDLNRPPPIMLAERGREIEKSAAEKTQVALAEPKAEPGMPRAMSRSERESAAPTAAASSSSTASPAAPANSDASENDALYRQALAMENGGDARGAIRIYRRAARAGNGSAAKRLGEIFDKGVPGVSRDYAESLQWYEIARQLGETVTPAAAR